MRIHQTCPLLLLLLLVAAVNAQLTVRERHRKFINQHVNEDMSQTRCDSVMRRRHITQTDSNRCKERNTFIRATNGLITPICRDAGTPYPGGLTLSTGTYDLVVCDLRSQGSYPNCQYRGRRLRPVRKIAIACEAGVPVHYGDDIVFMEN